MTEDRSKVLDLIEKLMRRTKEGANATESEVEQAVALARTLMRKHNIEMAEILEREDKALEEDDVVELQARDSVKLDRHEKTLAHVVCLVCEVKWFYRTRNVINGNGRITKRHSTVFYGIKSDVDAARLLYCELLIIVKALARGRIGKGTSPRHFAYCDGFSTGLYAKVKAEREREKTEKTAENVKALIVVKEGLIVRHEQKLSLRKAKTRANVDRLRSGEYGAGYMDGQAYDLDRPSKNGKVKSEKRERIGR